MAEIYFLVSVLNVKKLSSALSGDTLKSDFFGHHLETQRSASAEPGKKSAVKC